MEGTERGGQTRNQGLRVNLNLDNKRTNIGTPAQTVQKQNTEESERGHDLNDIQTKTRLG